MMNRYEMKTVNQKTKRMLWLCYLFFGIIGFVLGMRTSIFYYVQEAYLDSYSTIANMILVSGICMQISLFLAGIFIQKLGYKRILNIGLSAFTLSILLMYLVNGFMDFAIVYTLLMFSYGIAVIILNLYVSILVPERKSNNLMMLHLFFCIGALIGPKWISFFYNNGISWQWVTALTGIPLLIIVAITLGTKEFAGNQKEKEVESIEIPMKNSKVLIALFIIVFMCSQIWEYGIGTWFIIFASKSKGIGSGESSSLLTLFYAMYPLVRIVLFKVIHKFDLHNLLIGAFLYSAALATIGAVTGMPLFYSLTGAGVAVMYPALMAFMQERLGANAERKIGFITMIGGLLQYVAIWSVGIVSDSYGIGVGFNYMIIYLVVGTIGIIGMKLKSSNSKSRHKKRYGVVL